MPDATSKSSTDLKFSGMQQGYMVTDWAKEIGASERQLRESIRALGTTEQQLRETCVAIENVVEEYSRRWGK